MEGEEEARRATVILTFATGVGHTGSEIAVEGGTTWRVESERYPRRYSGTLATEVREATSCDGATALVKITFFYCGRRHRPKKQPWPAFLREVTALTRLTERECPHAPPILDWFHGYDDEKQAPVELLLTRPVPGEAVCDMVISGKLQDAFLLNKLRNAFRKAWINVRACGVAHRGPPDMLWDERTNTLMFISFTKAITYEEVPQDAERLFEQDSDKLYKMFGFAQKKASEQTDGAAKRRQDEDAGNEAQAQAQTALTVR